MVYSGIYPLEACRTTVPRGKLARRRELELLVNLPRH